ASRRPRRCPPPATMRAHGLVLDDIRIEVAGRTLVALSAEVPPGRVLTVMGPSGSGKSALLAFVGGFLDGPFRAQGRVFAGTVELTQLPSEHPHARILFHYAPV